MKWVHPEFHFSNGFRAHFYAPSRCMVRCAVLHRTRFAGLRREPYVGRGLPPYAKNVRRFLSGHFRKSFSSVQPEPWLRQLPSPVLRGARRNKVHAALFPPAAKTSLHFLVPPFPSANATCGRWFAEGTLYRTRIAPSRKKCPEISLRTFS